jgi:hypothetical protein
MRNAVVGPITEGAICQKVISIIDSNVRFVRQ